MLGEGRHASRPLRVGSVKTNIGHLEPASGIAGLIKVALALKHRQIPPESALRAAHPDIPFDELKLRVPTALEPWPDDGGPALAGINSFGFGGTNAHAILEGPPLARRASERNGNGHAGHAGCAALFALSAIGSQRGGAAGHGAIVSLHCWRARASI